MSDSEVSNESCTFVSTFALFPVDSSYFQELVTKEEWRNATQEELSVIHKNRTLDLMECPKEKNVIGLKWVFRKKYNPNGSVQKYKAQVVAKGTHDEKESTLVKPSHLLLASKR